MQAGNAEEGKVVVARQLERRKNPGPHRNCTCMSSEYSDEDVFWPPLEIEKKTSPWQDSSAGAAVEYGKI